VKKVLYFLVIFWVFLSVFNIFYNVKKTITEIQEWSVLSDNQKRHKIFGDLYDFFIQVNKYTEPNAKILVSSNDGMTSGIGRYYIYPRMLIWPREEKKFKELVKEKKISYIFSYNKFLSFSGYKKIASFSSKTSTNYAILYKLQ
jgi:hypothetical protein